jgi:hypothetical protein
MLHRRDFLTRCCGGMGGLALGALAARAEAGGDPLRPLAPRAPHLPGKAKRVIFLFQYGGPSQVDTWDRKPELKRLDGQAVPKSFKGGQDKVGGVFTQCHDRLMAEPWSWSRYGESGLEASELMARTARHADDLCLIRSLQADSSNHAPATYQMNTGIILPGRPSLGSWLTYGLGSENQNLPGYVLLFKVGGLGGSPNWSNGFLPAAFQGTKFRHEGPAVLNLQPPAEFASTQRESLDALGELNRLHREGRDGLLELDGRIASYELAYRMQAEAMDVGDLATEPKETLREYGIEGGSPEQELFGRLCLLARRLSEKGVRVVQLYNANDKFGWDGHDKNAENHRKNAAETDRAVGALLSDLKRRGLLEETLVIWGGEFGRTPMEQGNKGRNHNPYGFTMWLAGGGVKGGRAIGGTDELGLRAVQDARPVKDLHATILAAMGLRADDLYFEANGRQERLTGVAGSAKLIPGVLA